MGTLCLSGCRRNWFLVGSDQLPSCNCHDKIARPGPAHQHYTTFLSQRQQSCSNYAARCWNVDVARRTTTFFYCATTTGGRGQRGMADSCRSTYHLSFLTAYNWLVVDVPAITDIAWIGIGAALESHLCMLHNTLNGANGGASDSGSIDGTTTSRSNHIHLDFRRIFNLLGRQKQKGEHLTSANIKRLGPRARV